MKFKRGAFVSIKPIIPVYIKVSYLGCVNPVYDVCDFWDLVIMLFSSFTIAKVTLTMMPVFHPN